MDGREVVEGPGVDTGGFDAATESGTLDGLLGFIVGVDTGADAPEDGLPPSNAMLGAAFVIDDGTDPPDCLMVSA